MDDASHADRKARLAAAVRDFTPPRPIRYAALWPYQAEIETLRSKKASCRVIRDLLQQANVSVSLDTVARFCREVIEEKPARPQKTSTGVRRSRPVLSEPVSEARPDERPMNAPPIAEQHAGAPVPESPAQSRRGPRIADPKNV